MRIAAHSGRVIAGIVMLGIVMFMLIPATRYNEGLLAERVLRYFQPQGVEMHYDKDTQEITLKAPKSLILAVLRHIETIARRSREYREAHPFAESPKAHPLFASRIAYVTQKISAKKVK